LRGKRGEGGGGKGGAWRTHVVRKNQSLLPHRFGVENGLQNAKADASMGGFWRDDGK